MIANKNKQMQLQYPVRKIPKLRVQFHPNRHRFSLPSENRYFTRVLINKKLLSQSQPVDLVKETNPSEHKLNRSLSLSYSAHQGSEKGNLPIKNVVSLPKIDSRAIVQGENQIIRSELGGLNMADIFKLEQGEQNQRKKSQISRTTSIAEEEEYERDEEQPKRQGAEERPYQYYDSYLMKQEPRMYRAKHFKLKHKADWSISLGNM